MVAGGNLLARSFAFADGWAAVWARFQPIAKFDFRQDSIAGPKPFARLWSRKAVGMLARNTVVSCVVFLVGLIILWGLVKLGCGKLPAAALSFLAANTLHYVAGRNWIFQGTTRGLEAGYILFLGNSIIGLVVTLLLFAALLRLTAINYLVARALVSLAAGLVVFLLNATLNFRRL